MKLDDNAQMVAMLNHTKGSIENKIRQAYNSGYNDGFVQGIAKAYEDIRKSIETSVIQLMPDIPSKDEPQTCSFSDCDNFKNPDYERCIECKRKQIKLKTEQTEREGE